jgi:hypothetical protein
MTAIFMSTGLGGEPCGVFADAVADGGVGLIV